jgi:hypothetical protein
MRKRKYNYGREVLFNLLGILAILVLFAAGMFDGIRLKWTANLRTPAQSRNALSRNSLSRNSLRA